MYCKPKVLKQQAVWRSAAPTLVLQYPLVTDGATSDSQGTQTMLLHRITQPRLCCHRERCGGFLFVVGVFLEVFWVCSKKLNMLYLKLVSGKIYLVFWGFEKAECLLALGCLCPCSNESHCMYRNEAGHLDLTVPSLWYPCAQAQRC